METTINNIIHHFESAAPSQYEEIRNRMKQAGYAGFSEFLSWIRQKLRDYADSDIVQMESLLQKAKEVFPQPEQFSPSWQNTWQDFYRLFQCKNEILHSVPEAKREGEWQVILDNPYTQEGVVCHPGLSFMEAAYLFGQFHLDLKRNEYIRLQKIEHVIMRFGS